MSSNYLVHLCSFFYLSLPTCLCRVVLHDQVGQRVVVFWRRLQQLPEFVCCTEDIRLLVLWQLNDRFTGMCGGLLEEEERDFRLHFGFAVTERNIRGSVTFRNSLCPLVPLCQSGRFFEVQNFRRPPIPGYAATHIQNRGFRSKCVWSQVVLLLVVYLLSGLFTLSLSSFQLAEDGDHVSKP